MDEYLRKKAIFETNTVQYITKPFTQLDISVAMDLAIKTIKGHNLSLQNGDCTSHLNNECIFVKENQGFRKIMIGDILFIKADRAYSELVFRNNSINKKETIIFSENLSILEEKLFFAKELIRVNRSYVVNSNFIKKTRENALWIEDVEIPIGKTYRNAIRDRFRFI
jgi:DNA-binding LytR/AlgR family response regulator